MLMLSLVLLEMMLGMLKNNLFVKACLSLIVIGKSVWQKEINKMLKYTARALDLVGVYPLASIRKHSVQLVKYV